MFVLINIIVLNYSSLQKNEYSRTMHHFVPKVCMSQLEKLGPGGTAPIQGPPNWPPATPISTD